MRKLYKFRSLENELLLCRAKWIIETGEFWCSRFWDLNDPMEGVYLTRPGQDQGQLAELYREKKTRVICSFSGPTAFTLPIMWGYYANGFKGIAIEIEVEEVEAKEIKQVDYRKTLPSLSGGDGDPAEEVDRILTTKLDIWRHEAEFRHISEGNTGNRPIGKITAVYFGSPYSNIDNAIEIQGEAASVKGYQSRAEELAELIKSRKIEYRQVQVNDNMVVT